MSAAFATGGKRVGKCRWMTTRGKERGGLPRAIGIGIAQGARGECLLRSRDIVVAEFQLCLPTIVEMHETVV